MERRQRLHQVVRPAVTYKLYSKPQRAQDKAWREGVVTLALLLVILIVMSV